MQKLLFLSFVSRGNRGMLLDLLEYFYKNDNHFDFTSQTILEFSSWLCIFTSRINDLSNLMKLTKHFV